MESNNIYEGIDKLNKRLSDEIINKIDISVNNIDNILNEVFEKHLMYEPATEYSVKESWNFLKRLAEAKKKELENEES